MLSFAEAVLLWNVVVIWGHPQDAIAVAFAMYSVIFALDRRFAGAGWLFGIGLAFQPLTIVVFPILLGIGGRAKAFGLTLRGVVPAAALLIGPFVADFHGTYRSVVVQPAFPDTRYNHRTPWTALAPTISGRGAKTTVGGGPLRVVVLASAAALGWVVIRWRNRPEMVVWAVAVALALRCYLEAVMTPYYVWPALAVAVVVAARGTWPGSASSVPSPSPRRSSPRPGSVFGPGGSPTWADSRPCSPSPSQSLRSQRPTWQPQRPAGQPPPPLREGDRAGRAAHSGGAGSESSQSRNVQEEAKGRPLRPEAIRPELS